MDIRIDAQLWATSMAPEGVLERWRVSEGSDVRGGEAIAEVRIEDCLHEIIAPGPGRISQLASEGALIEPGTMIASIAG